eukprot:CAMPEP_0202510888 /NCGR_PEP_ID=MMETSP1361-20130828/53525_1 /ASSEMBLY_ACC=CAM_ASM_000849 /TAXON_ID=210615 /ORGANISM="Staurosira complex sp., Strain CCMP2646" /LENGTH=63 /DNA_ID=CAMNT_0049145163 /DNA_START=490 /DNA_END=681 /DNA_ORIENTATION=-
MFLYVSWRKHNKLTVICKMKPITRAAAAQQASLFGRRVGYSARKYLTGALEAGLGKPLMDQEK